MLNITLSNLPASSTSLHTAGEPAHPILETFRRLGAINPATAKPWQVVGLANYLNPFYDTQVGASSTCVAPHSLYAAQLLQM
jgi:hypothetical protein